MYASIAINQRRRRLVLAGIATTGLAGCGGGSSPNPAAAAAPGAAQPASAGANPAASTWPTLPMLHNTAAAGGFTATLNAAAATMNFVPGIATRVLAYNGTTPGPTVEAYEGDRVRISFGNHLDQDTTVHWHGLPVPHRRLEVPPPYSASAPIA